MAELVAIAAGLLVAMLLVGITLYLGLDGIEFQWDSTSEQQQEP